MKKMLFLFFSVVLVFNLLGCSKKEDENKLVDKTLKLYDNKKYDEALKYSKKLCDLGHPAFCYVSAVIIEGTGKKQGEANKFYKKGCEIKIKRIDGNRSKNIFESDLKEKNSCCYNYARNLYKQKNVLKANDILVDLCNNKKYIPACEGLVGIAIDDNDDKKMAVKYIAKTIKIYKNLNNKEQEKYADDITKLKAVGMQLCVFGTVMDNLMSGKKDYNMSDDCKFIIKGVKK